MQIENIRKNIDKLDVQLVELFKKRLMMCADVARYKKDNKIRVYDPKREKEILSKLTSNENSDFKDLIEKLYLKIFRLSKFYQHALLENLDEM